MTQALGTRLPELTLLDDQGEPVDLRKHAGQRVVLYFYPKDDTPGCTTQACDLRDNWNVFAGRDDIVLYGVSADDAASHAKFREKYDLPFPLLVDEDHQLAEALGLWVKKKMYGKVFWGIQRGTVVIGPDGTVEQAWPKVKPKEHVAMLREYLGI